jgi:hypothetical protein
MHRRNYKCVQNSVRKLQINRSCDDIWQKHGKENMNIDLGEIVCGGAYKIRWLRTATDLSAGSREYRNKNRELPRWLMVSTLLPVVRRDIEIRTFYIMISTSLKPTQTPNRCTI